MFEVRTEQAINQAKRASPKYTHQPSPLAHQRAGMSHTPLCRNGDNTKCQKILNTTQFPTRILCTHVGAMPRSSRKAQPIQLSKILTS
eukprot:1095994-Pelagomonas_calceolata.AAC.1